MAHARRLEALVKDIGERPGPAAGPGNILEKKGALPRPAPGQVAGTFGKHKHPRFPTYTVRSGIVIDAPDGTAVACIEAGRVVFADWFTGYGKLVIVDHGDKVYSLYARVDELEVKVGDVVAAGQVIARVADPGGADVRGLYFEIRRGAQAVDPLGWLSRRSP
ncbi:MAG: peptidoglycan DD-metalloendopeptidase family protein [Acidobacteriota bacterium]